MGFEREERYFVIKKKDCIPQMTKDAQAIVGGIDFARSIMGEPERKYLVIEADWPEFEPAWDAIQRRMEGRPTREAELQAEVERLQSSSEILAKAVLSAHEPETLDEICADGGVGSGFAGHICHCETCEIARSVSRLASFSTSESEV